MASNKDATVALFHAVKAHNWEAAEEALAAGADINHHYGAGSWYTGQDSGDVEYYYSYNENCGFSGFYDVYAGERPSKEVLDREEIIYSTSSVSFCAGDTLLHMSVGDCIRSNRFDTVLWLKDHGADPTATNQYGKTAEQQVHECFQRNQTYYREEYETYEAVFGKKEDQ